ncbi:MAG: glycosyltransferase family 9 protein [Acidobacteria bacterium]|nr:glycosyltransferase family 9 protein [Acidobacteriota bacterium]
MSNSINWQNVNRVLVVRLRSIGDTVLSTPSLIALRRLLPNAQIDILLEDWVAPLLEGFEEADNVLRVSRDPKARLRIARELRKQKYDVAFNLHGGTTATFFVRASGAVHRVGYSNYSYSFLYTHLLSSSSEFWGKEKTHSAEQQLALLGFVGVPVRDRPKTHLNITDKASRSIEEKLDAVVSTGRSKLALIHPVAAFETKQWATENFAKIAEFLSEKGFQVAAAATKKEREVLTRLKEMSKARIITFDDLTLPEISALASRSRIFVGNDSGIAHIAAAVKTPSVVIFGSSNRDHWRPWTDTPNEIVYEEFSCQPCPGYVCEKFGKPKCILSVSVKQVESAVDRVLKYEH